MGFIPKEELSLKTLTEEEKRSIDNAVYFLYDSLKYSALYESDHTARATGVAVTVTKVTDGKSSKNEVLRPGETIDPSSNELIYIKIK